MPLRRSPWPEHVPTALELSNPDPRWKHGAPWPDDTSTSHTPGTQPPGAGAGARAAACGVRCLPARACSCACFCAALTTLRAYQLQSAPSFRTPPRPARQIPQHPHMPRSGVLQLTAGAVVVAGLCVCVCVAPSLENSIVTRKASQGQSQLPI